VRRHAVMLDHLLLQNISVLVSTKCSLFQVADRRFYDFRLMWCLHDPANVQQTFSKCIQNTRANAGRLLDVCWKFAGSCKHPITAMKIEMKFVMETALLCFFCFVLSSLCCRRG